VPWLALRLQEGRSELFKLVLGHKLKHRQQRKQLEVIDRLEGKQPRILHKGSTQQSRSFELFIISMSIIYYLGLNISIADAKIFEILEVVIYDALDLTAEIDCPETCRPVWAVPFFCFFLFGPEWSRIWREARVVRRIPVALFTAFVA
jgi:hypothetical protein